MDWLLKVELIPCGPHNECTLVRSPICGIDGIPESAFGLLSRLQSTEQALNVINTARVYFHVDVAGQHCLTSFYSSVGSSRRVLKRVVRGN